MKQKFSILSGERLWRTIIFAARGAPRSVAPTTVEKVTSESVGRPLSTVESSPLSGEVA